MVKKLKKKDIIFTINMNANITITRNGSSYKVKVEGRATLNSSTPVKNFAENIIPGILKIDIEMERCIGMDSTFMGTLAMLAMRAKKSNIPVRILNANKKIYNLLRELGIHELFEYNNYNTSAYEGESFENITRSLSSEDTGETALEAHETLMKLNDENKDKFKNVVDFLKEDLDKKKDNNED